MNSRTYYGEYTLGRWIELILKENILLPEYQRSWVWEEKHVNKLIASLKEGQFILPVTIAQQKKNDKSINLLIDGQQRLTSILLSYIGYFPIKEKFGDAENLTTEDDAAFEDGQGSNNNPRYEMEWTFREIIKLGKNKHEIVENIKNDDKYKELESSEIKQLPEDFWNKKFIGFSYIIPETDDIGESQAYFSKLFYNMNYLGKRLSILESRKSLYYQDPQFTSFFEFKISDKEDALCGLKIFQDFKPKKIDIVRYLSILSQKKAEKIPMVGYSAYKAREEFYEDYVSYIVGQDQNNRVDKFNGFNFKEVFPNKEELENRIKSLKGAIETIKPKITFSSSSPQSFNSYIDADYWLFGVIFYIFFEKKTLTDNDAELEKLSKKIKDKIDNKSNYYKQNSNRVGNIRQRMNESINIYEKYVS